MALTRHCANIDLLTERKNMKNMYQRDHIKAFENAKQDANFKPDEFMYMYSKDGCDYFKNTNFRNYVSFQYTGEFRSYWNLSNIK
jgi:hypothetical protein